jgi:copper resistance protein B
MHRTCLLVSLIALASPAVAQDHAGHEAGEDQQMMEHPHHQMDEASTGPGASAADAPIPQGPPPPEAFEGPTYAADQSVGADRMNSSRLDVVRKVSGMPVAWLHAERLEYRARDGEDGYLWDVQGYYGGDYDKLWVKSEGEGSFDEDAESAEVQALWSHAISPWWDFQAGVRQDLTGSTRTHAFLSDEGNLTGRIEAEFDQRITQRLILQPRTKLVFSAQDIADLNMGAGLHKAEVGLRLRYEIKREFAPYIGIEQEWRLGDSADYARAAGEDSSVTNYLLGIRAWF